MSFKYTPISKFSKTQFTAALSSGKKITHDVYTRGKGAPVVLIQELPGIGKETLRLADKLIARGFKVIMPHMFGPLERTAMVGNIVRVLCMRREFHIFTSGKSSPVIDWLRALCRTVRTEERVKGVGVIGMCLTGNFAISLMGDDSVLAAVASQPALPVGKQGSLDMSPQEIAAAKKGIDQKGPMMALRFETDMHCTAKKFACINETFNEEDNERIQLTTLPGKGHSVLTVDFVDEEGHPTERALQEVLEYFSDTLQN